ncbi:MAG: UvrB/UvrC motif-containing protein, partial [Alphaproteobacteria bacterium]
NVANGVTPESIQHGISDTMQTVYDADFVTVDLGISDEGGDMTLQERLADLETRMRTAAADLEFEEAARLRDEIRRRDAMERGLKTTPPAAAMDRKGRRKTKKRRGP